MYLLNNGIEIPEVGFGTWKMKDREQCINAVYTALKTGYRHIDTAAVYGNEEYVGEGIKKFLDEGKVKREELFIVTKVWNTDQGYETTLKAFEVSLKKLGLEYLDMYLLHWPQPKELERTWETWRAIETLYSQGKVRAIGTCNMKIHHLNHIINNYSIVPAVNQVELHPNWQQKELRDYCKENGIIVESWSPLMQGEMSDPTLVEIAERNKKSVAQIILKWHLQSRLLPLPKSVTPLRIEENFALDFSLSPDDMAKIDMMDNAGRIGPDPDEITF